jgi:hypothetical protein
MPINNIIKVAKPAIINIPETFENFENRHNEITKRISYFSSSVLFGCIYRNQHFKFVRNIFKFFPHFFRYSKC